MSPTLTDALELTRLDERRRAARALLRTPLIRAAAADGLQALVRRHESWLRQWFDVNTGWRLLVNGEIARLVKTSPASVEGSSPGREGRGRPPFTRRRYVLAALAMAGLERADAQITLGRLAEQVLVDAADPALAVTGLTFSLDTREQRADLVAVVRLLLSTGVLRKVAGDEEGFLKADGDALYDIDRRVLAAILAAPRGPSTITATDFEARLQALAAEPVPPTEEQRTRRLRHALTRRLLDDPVLYLTDLDEEELAYLTGQRSAITARISELTGLVPEIRAEGIAMVDPHDDLTDVRMPETGTDGHATLLIAEYLAARRSVVPIDELHRHVRSQATEHRSHWRAAAQEPGAEVEITGAPWTASSPCAWCRFVTAPRAPSPPWPATPWPPPPSWSADDPALTLPRALAAAAGRPRGPLLLRRRGVPVPRRPPAPAWQQRHRQVQGARPPAAVPARR